MYKACLSIKSTKVMIACGYFSSNFSLLLLFLFDEIDEIVYEKLKIKICQNFMMLGQ